MAHHVAMLVITLFGAYAALVSAAESVPSLNPVHTIFEFPTESYIENIAVRSNGQVLVSNLSKPQLYLFNPSSSGEAEPILVHEFTESLAVAGIAEYQPDIFAVIVGNASFTSNMSSAGTWSIWTVDMRGVDILTQDKKVVLSPPPGVRRIAHVQSAQFLNGMSLLSAEDQTLLVGDVNGGVIYRLDIKTGYYKVVINNTYTNLYPSPPLSPSGVDGLHVRGSTLYFTNFGNGTFNKMPINRDGTPAGPVTTIARNLSLPDDFTFDCDGNAFVVTGGGNTVEMISADGKQQVTVAGNLNSTIIAEPTACAFGRGIHKNLLYVVTAGGMVVPVDGNISIGGQFVAVKTGSRGSACC